MSDRKSYTFMLTILTMMFVVSLIVANIIAGKLWMLPFGIIIAAGTICFPITYIINDVIPEVYGWKIARETIWLGFAANAFAVVMFLLATYVLVAPPFWKNQSAFEIVLGFTPRLLLASFCGYLIGTHANSWIMTRMKAAFGPKNLWTRTIGSTIVGEGLDSTVFILLAFALVLPWSALPMLVVAQWIFKVLYETVATPFTYLIVNKVKAVEGVDQFAA